MNFGKRSLFLIQIFYKYQMPIKMDLSIVKNLRKSGLSDGKSGDPIEPGRGGQAAGHTHHGPSELAHHSRAKI